MDSLGSRPNIAVFVDWLNCEFTDPRGALRIDVRKLKSFIHSLGAVKFIYTYVIDFSVVKDTIPDHKSWLQLLLEKNDFLVRCKRASRMTDNNGRRVVKGNHDVELTIDVMDTLNFCPEVDTVVIFSGDGDFRALLDRIHTEHRKIKTIVISFERNLSKRLRRGSDSYKLLDVIMPQLIAVSATEKVATRGRV